MQWNARGINSDPFNLKRELIITQNTDIVALNEQWRATKLKHYTGYFKEDLQTRSKKINVSTHVKSSLNQTTESEIQTTENLIAINILGHDLCLINIYIRPHYENSASEVVETITLQLYELMVNSNKIFIVLGDFNRNKLIATNLRNLGFKNAKLPATHQNHISPDSLEDLQQLYYKKCDAPSSEVIHSSLRLSDHAAVKIIIKTTNYTKTSFRIPNRRTATQIASLLSTRRWADVSQNYYSKPKRLTSKPGKNSKLPSSSRLSNFIELLESESDIEAITSQLKQNFSTFAYDMCNQL